MNAVTTRITEGLRKAIQAEIDGFNFYMMAAQTTADSKGRQVFETLAQEEVEHANFLRDQLNSMVETGKWDESVKLGAGVVLDGMSPIFSDDLRERVKGANFEMSAVSIGAQLELSSVRFYEAEAEAIQDENVAAFYQDLAVWEQDHYDALIRQLQQLRGEHWDVADFG
jgi:rubrerythrin